MRIFILVLCCFAITAACASSSLKANDSLPATEYKLSKPEFIQRYGKDDSSKALIRFYFHKRERAQKMIFIPVIAGSVTAAFIAVAASNSSNNSGYEEFFFYEFMSLIVTAALVLTLTGVVRCLLFTRRKLLLRLRQYEAERYIPENITASKLFKMSLKGEPAPWRRPRRNPVPHKKLKYYQDQ